MRSYADLRSGVFCQPVGAKRRCIAELKHNRRWPVVAGQRPRQPVQNLHPSPKKESVMPGFRPLSVSGLLACRMDAASTICCNTMTPLNA